MTPQERWNARLAREGAERRKKMERLRRQGYTLRQIGDLFGVSRQRVWNVLNSEKIA